MKFKFLLFILIIWQTGISQVGVGTGFVGKQKRLGKKQKAKIKDKLENFKKTKTIFVLSDIYDKPTYDSILKASWHVTPFEVVKQKDFNFNDYGGDQYSFARIVGNRTTKINEKNHRRSVSLRLYIEIVMYDFDKINEKLDRMSPRRRANNISNIFDRYKIDIAQILLYPTGKFAMYFVKVDQFKIIPDEEKTKKKIVEKINTDDVFINYKPGFLKNYFQKVNDLIQKNQVYWMYVKNPESLPELKNLKKKTLYVPDFVARKYLAFSGSYKKPDKAYLDKLFKNYNYKYQMISSDELNKKIMQNELIYYLMYVRLNSERFVSVVNAQTGEIVYRAYFPMGYNLKSKHISKLNKAIQKAAKN